MNHILRKFLYALICVAMISSLSTISTNASSLSLPEAKTILVSITTGTDVAGCGSELQPCRSIQYAVNLAASGDTILVAKGTYTYNGIDPCTSQINRSVVCWWDKQLTINGGYSEDNWTVADLVNNLTIIDGGSQYRGVIVWRVSGTASLSMQGFTIQNARAVGKPDGLTYAGHAFGAGMWATKSYVNLKNVTFKNNIATGGTNFSISQAGWAFGAGLAIEGPNGGTSTLEKITFVNNQALGGSGSNVGGNGVGGGLFAGEAAVTASEITLTNNIARGGNTPGNACPGPASGYGGAIALQRNAGFNFSYITATGNQAIGSNAAGGSSCGGNGIGAVFFLEQATVNISDSLLKSNQSIGGLGTTGGVGWAGGVYTERANLNLDRVKVISNTATSGASSSGSGPAGPAGGGGAYMSAWDGGNYWANITNSLFAENKAVMGTPGTKVQGGGGGAVFIQGIAANITHSTFANNNLENGISVGQGVLVIGAPISGGTKPGSVNIKYSVFTDHRNNLTYNNSAVQVFSGNSGSLSYVWFGNNKSDTAGTFTSDHVWHDTRSAGYISPGSPNYDYHLNTDSPVIDLATSSATNIDLDRQSRPVGPLPDLGAYEYSVPTLKAEKPVLYVMTDTSAIISLTDLILVTTGPVAEWVASTSSNWVYLGPSGTSQQTTGQTGSNLTIRFDPSKISLGSYVVTINLTSQTANPTTITIYFYYVDKVEKAYLPAVLK
jgi:hypothetical protein